MPFEPNMPASQDIPTGADQQQPDTNPVIDALKTIQLFTASLKEKNPEQAQQVEQALIGLLQAIKGGEGAPSPAETNPEGGASPSNPAPIGNQGGSKQMASRAIPMNANKNAVPIM